MRSYLILIALFFSMCKSNQKPQQEFAGSFTGTMNGYPSSSELSVDGKILKGSISMNGEVAIVTGTVQGTYCEGKIIDNNDAAYDFTGSITGDELRLSITPPDGEGSAIEMVLNRKSDSRENNNNKTSGQKNNADELNSGLFGEWVHTEILGGGTEFSMTNESLIEFLEDGTFLTWPGRSVGSGYSRNEDKSNASEGKWYTDGNSLHLIDTEREVAINYTLDANRFLMNLENGNKLYTRRR